MNGITQEDINKALKTCQWRTLFDGIPICTGNCGPCQIEIELGRCQALIELFKGHDHDKKDSQN